MSQITITARELIRQSLKTLAILGDGENPSAGEANDGLMLLNEIVDKWNTENLMTASFNKIEIPLVFGQSRYEISGMPISGIDSVYMQTSNISSHIRKLTKTEYENISNKTETNGNCNAIYYNASYPIAELYVHPCGSGSSSKIVMAVQSVFDIFPDLDTEINLQSGYIMALRLNLAVNIAPYFSVAASQTVMEQAVGAKSFIKDNNNKNKPLKMRCDKALNSRRPYYNIFSDGV